MITHIPKCMKLLGLSLPEDRFSLYYEATTK